METKRKGQQEIVGFVLIVVLVVVALLIFLLISSRKSTENLSSAEADNMLGIIMTYTTDCAIVFEPQYDSVEDLIKSCHNNEKCSNLNKMACDYLNTTMNNVTVAILKASSDVSAFQINIFQNSSGSSGDVIAPIRSGNCTGNVIGSVRKISTSNGDISVKLLLCK